MREGCGYEREGCGCERGVWLRERGVATREGCAYEVPDGPLGAISKEKQITGKKHSSPPSPIPPPLLIRGEVGEVSLQHLDPRYGERDLTDCLSAPPSTQLQRET